MAEIFATDEFEAWFLKLSDEDGEAVVYLTRLLEQKGLALGAPYSSALKGSRYPFRELRSKSRGRAIRVLYAYDTRRDAVLVIGGDKRGNPRFYKEIIPLAERIWKQYLAEQAKK
ncbi:MAG: type II toxin-antitoxin system RelE/ParE family toxin [Polyangia bacterium]|jgi:hypothetical protein